MILQPHLLPSCHDICSRMLISASRFKTLHTPTGHVPPVLPLSSPVPVSQWMTLTADFAGRSIPAEALRNSVTS